MKHEMPDSDPRWSAWRRAEAALHAPDELAEAVASLPPRQGRILRAMAALEKGDRAEVDRLSRDMLDAGEKDLVCLLRLCLLAAPEIDPTEIRRRAKELGVPNGPGLPILDLVRLFAVALGDGKHARPPSLARAGFERPVLDAVLPLFSSKFTVYQRKNELLPLSRRLTTYWAAATGWTLRRADVRAFVRGEVPEAVAPFPEKEWPDLGQVEPRDPLGRWLAASPPPSWSKGLGRYVELVLGHRPRPVRRRVLGRLLVRIDEILREGQPREAGGPVAAALFLTDSLDGEAGPSALTHQIARLVDRLDWWSGERERPIDLVSALWEELRGGTVAERARFAESVLEGMDDGESLPQPLRGELLAELVLSEADEDNDVPSLLLVAARHIPHRTLERAVARLENEPLAEFLLGFHELARGDGPASLYRASRLYELPGGEEHASRLAIQAVKMGIDPGRRASRRQRRALERLLDTLEEYTPSIGLAAFLPLAILHVLGEHEAGPRVARLAPALQRALAVPRDPGDPGVGDEMFLLALLGEEERGRARLREIGRHLRRHRHDPRAWEHALGLAGRFSAPPPPRPLLLQTALDGVSSFLLHRGPDVLFEHFRVFWAAHLKEDGPVLMTWIAEHRSELGDDPEWDEMAEYDPGDEPPEWMEDPDFSPEGLERAVDRILGGLGDGQG